MLLKIRLLAAEAHSTTFTMIFSSFHVEVFGCSFSALSFFLGLQFNYLIKLFLAALAKQNVVHLEQMLCLLVQNTQEVLPSTSFWCLDNSM